MASPCRALPKLETTDLNLASFLRCRNHPVTEILSRSGRTVFVFDESQELRDAILEFVNDGPVPVRSFCNTLRDLKSLTRSVG